MFVFRLIDSQGVELDAQETRISIILAHTRSAFTLQRADHLRSSAVTVPGAAGSLGAASSESAVGFGRLWGRLRPLRGRACALVSLQDGCEVLRFVCVIRVLSHIRVSMCPVCVPAPPGVYEPIKA